MSKPLLRDAAQRVRSLPGCRRGATVVEYGMIIAILILTMLVGFRPLANATNNYFATVNSSSAAAMR